MKNNI